MNTVSTAAITFYCKLGHCSLERPMVKQNFFSFSIFPCKKGLKIQVGMSVFVSSGTAIRYVLIELATRRLLLRFFNDFACWLNGMVSFSFKRSFHCKQMRKVVIFVTIETGLTHIMSLTSVVH